MFTSFSSISSMLKSKMPFQTSYQCVQEVDMSRSYSADKEECAAIESQIQRLKESFQQLHQMDSKIIMKILTFGCPPYVPFWFIGFPNVGMAAVFSTALYLVTSEYQPRKELADKFDAQFKKVLAIYQWCATNNALTSVASDATFCHLLETLAPFVISQETIVLPLGSSSPRFSAIYATIPKPETIGFLPKGRWGGFFKTTYQAFERVVYGIEDNKGNANQFKPR